MKLIFFLLISFTVSASSKDIINDKNGVAVGGYDVVAYFTNAKKSINKGIKGKKELAVTYKNHKYYFSSESNKKAFQQSPEKYLPQYGGWCAWAVAEGNTDVPVNFNTFLIAIDETGQERLYLFYNSWGINTLKKWQKKEHGQLVNAANKVWSDFIN